MVFVAGSKHGLFADYAGAANFLHAAVCVGDVPVAVDKLYGLIAHVFELDGVGPDIVMVFWVGLLFQIDGDNGDFNVVCCACVHDLVFSGCNLGGQP